MNAWPPVDPIDCDAAVRRLWDALDGELEPTRLAEVESHLLTCAECREHFAFARHFLRSVRESWPRVEDTTAMQQRIRARLTAEGFRVA